MCIVADSVVSYLPIVNIVLNFLAKIKTSDIIIVRNRNPIGMDTIRSQFSGLEVRLLTGRVHTVSETGKNYYTMMDGGMEV
jgi:hypothetical protein